MGIMFEADTKLLFAKYCLDIWLLLLKQVSLEGQKSQFSQCTVQFIYATFNQHFFFGFCYKLSNFQAIIDGYYILLSSDWAIWYNLTSPKNLFSNICFGILHLYNNFCKWSCQTIHANHWKVCKMLLCYPNVTL